MSDRRVRIILVIPRLAQESGGDPPLGLAYIASFLKKDPGLEINILDTAFFSSPKAVEARLEKEEPDIVGIYFSTPVYDYGVRIVHAAKRINAYVVAGGPHATVLPESIIPYVDAIIFGEGEVTFSEIVQAYVRGNKPDTVKGVWFKDNTRLVKNYPRESFLDLNNMPFPARDILDMDRYIANCQYFDSLSMRLRVTTIMASRGCPYQCSYCQPTLNKMFGTRVRLRNPNNVVEEIKYLRQSYSINAVFFHDDILPFNRKWIIDFSCLARKEIPGLIWGCNSRAELLDEGLIDIMYKGGLRSLHIGAESASQRILDNIYRKGIKLIDVENAVRAAKSRKIRTMCFFMLGAPTETKEELNKTIKFASRLGLDEAVFNIASALPGTKLYNLVKEMGFSLSRNFSDFNYYTKKSYTDGILTQRQLKLFQLKALIIFYLTLPRLRYILSHFISLGGIRRLLRKVRRFF